MAGYQSERVGGKIISADSIMVRDAHAVRPVVGGFVEADSLQAQLVVVSVPVSGIEDVERDLREIFGGRDGIEDDGLVFRQAGEKITYHAIAAIDQEGVIPCVDQLFIGDALHIGKVHHHALFGLAFSRNDVAGQGDFDGVTMPVQMPALAGVVGDAVSCIEFQAAGDEHDGCGQGGGRFKNRIEEVLNSSEIYVNETFKR